MVVNLIDEHARSTARRAGVWGEAFSYAGPGGAWFNRQT
jgi:hypothetical protein